MNALRWARMARPGLGGPASAVLRDLADRASESGVCWPAVATIAAETGYCERTVQYALRRLEAEQLVEVKFTGRGSRYTLAVPCTSEVQQLHLRGAAAAPKASRSRRLSARAREERPQAAAYAPALAHAPSDVSVDAAMLELARGWLRQ
jgi:hypothetical protein